MKSKIVILNSKQDKQDNRVVVRSNIFDSKTKYTVTVRNGIFETNSSSVHSIAIIPGHSYDPDDLYVCLRDKTGKMTFDAEKDVYIFVHLRMYGWGPMILSTVEEKLSYIASLIVGYSRNAISPCNMEENFVRHDRHIYDMTYTQYLSRYVKKQKDKDDWAIDEKEIRNDPEWKEVEETVFRVLPQCKGIKFIPSSGGVDHQSSGNINGKLDGTGISLERLIFDKNVLIVIDNDN